MNIRFLTILFAFGLLFAAPAFAMDLHDARNAGLVGEKPDGYVAAVKESPEVMSLVDEVNAKRKAEYARISGENQQPLGIVAKLAAKQIIEGLDDGNLYQDQNGVWQKR